ncbi:MAG: alpha/beta fold hydrolase [Inquilinus sp.]|nr:alpha/beta fold hydrolase [Inquilinus sp.]
MSFAKIVAGAFFRIVGAGGRAFDAIVVSLVPRPQVPKKRPYAVREVAVPGGADGVTLAGELTMPEGGGPFPAVVMVTGSGPQDRNEEVAGHKPFLVLSDRLTRRGYAVLRCDDRGVGGSGGDFAAAATPDFAADAAAALAWVRGNPAIDAERAGFVAHSMGGAVAAMAVPMERPDFMVLLAVPSQVLSAVVLRQQAEIGRASGIDEAMLAIQVNQAARLMEILQSSETPGEAGERIRSFLGGEGAPEADIRANLDLWATPWGLSIVDFDPVSALCAYDGPVLALFGDKDLQVSATANAPGMTSTLVDAASEVLILPGLNHLFQPSETGLPQDYWKIRTTIDEGAMNAIADWLDRARATPE